MQSEKRIWARLPLQKAYNVRELGGLPTAGGGQTAWRAFLRADDISALTEGDVALLLDYGVRTVIDLRSRSERERRPDMLGEKHGVANLHISFMDEADLSPEGMKKYAAAPMGDMYVAMLKRPEAVRQLFEAIAGAEPGCVLFHCAVGKDRTGVLALLLLMLAGVDKRDCINNYCQSYQNLLRNDEYFRKDAAAESRRIFESRADYVESAYDYVMSFGSAAAFLASCGVSEGVIGAVASRLIEG